MLKRMTFFILYFLVSVATQAYSKEIDFHDYPHLTAEMREKLAPHLMTNQHPMKKKLDKLFGKERITKDKQALKNAGFRVISERPRSFVIVAKHPLLKGYLVKCYMDTETRKKWDKPGWRWLVYRCVGAKKIKRIITTKRMKYFDVAKKWIYLLPLLDTKIPYKAQYIRHPALLLVSDMDLVSEEENLYAWKNKMTKRALDELYMIITYAKGSSYRPDNISYSRSGKFCFVDTEYPMANPNYEDVGEFLNAKMRRYWEYLIEKGGPTELEKEAI